MSFAIHLFMADKFPEASYRSYLDKLQNLYGKWVLAESSPINPGTGTWIHECFVQSENFSNDERFRVHVRSDRMASDIPWGFDYEWALHFETSAGRSATGLAVQLSALLLAMETFGWLCVVDHDSCIPDEPTEFRTKELTREHIRRIFSEEFSEYAGELRRRGILSENGYLLLSQ